MLVIGIDSRKDTLSACLVDHLGAALEYRTIANTPTGHRQLIDWAHTTNAARVAVEGSGTFGRPAAVAAMAAGLDIREVPPQLTARLRRRGRTQTKTDQVDAWVIARVALRDNTLAPPTFWEDTEDLRVLVSYRRELVEDRTARGQPAPRRPGETPTRLPPEHSPPHHPPEPRPSHQTVVAGHHPPRSSRQTTHPKTATTGHRDQRAHHRDRRTGHPVRNPATRPSRGGCAGRRHHPIRGRQPPPVCDQRQVCHGQRHRTHRSQQRTSSTPSTQPRWEPPNQPRHPHRRFDTDHPPRQRRPPLLPKTQNPRKDPQKSHTRPQKTNLRPHLDPPPTTKTNPDFDIGTHYPPDTPNRETKIAQLTSTFDRQRSLR